MYGLWSNLDKIQAMNGTFYLELDPNTLDLKTEQISTFDIAELQSLTGIQAVKRYIEKKQYIDEMQELFITSYDTQLSDGRYVAAYRRKAQTTAGDPAFEAGSIVVSTFGPKPADRKNTIIPVSQTSPGLDNVFTVMGAMINDKVVLVFNDHKSNTGITIGGEPEVYAPYPTQQKSTATYAVIVESNGSVKRQQIATLSTDNLVFDYVDLIISDDSFTITMIKDPNMSVLNSMKKDSEEDRQTYTIRILK